MRASEVRNTTVWVGPRIAESAAQNMMVLAVPHIAAWAALHMTALADLVTQVLGVPVTRA